MDNSIIYRAEFLFDNEAAQEFGIVFADSYSSASKYLEEYYADDLMGLELYMLDCGPLIINEDLFNKFKSGNF